jgi:intraflagellar transport protein 140
VQFRISAHESISAPEKKVKLSIAGDPEQLISLWVGDCLLCTSSNENMIRLWHLDDDENYVLTLFD